MYIVRCKICGCPLIGDCKSHPLYCETCAFMFDLETRRKRQQMKRKYQEELGTRDFSPNIKRNKDKSPNFLAEIRAVRKELRSLGLRKHGNSKTTKA